MGQTIVPRSTKEEGRRLFVSPHQPTGSSSDENTRSSKRARRTMIAASTLFRQRSQSRGSGEGARRGAREALHQRQKKTARMIQHEPFCLSGYNQEAGAVDASIFLWKGRVSLLNGGVSRGGRPYRVSGLDRGLTECQYGRVRHDGNRFLVAFSCIGCHKNRCPNTVQQ